MTAKTEAPKQAYQIYRNELLSNGNTESRYTGLAYYNEHEAAKVAGMLSLIESKEVVRFGVELVTYTVESR